jgi:hypothetical protein
MPLNRRMRIGTDQNDILLFVFSSAVMRKRGVANEYYGKLSAGYWLGHGIKPGLADLAQVNRCRGEKDGIDPTAWVEHAI